MERVLLYQEALAEVLRRAAQLIPAGSAAPVLLTEVFGRILAEPLIAERDQPPFPRSTRDGYAVRSEDLTSDGAMLHLLGSIRAGDHWQGPALQAGQAIEIMTGAPAPAGSDSVLMVEHTEQISSEKVKVREGRQLRPGENIVPTGAEARAGAVLVPQGRLLGTPEIGLAVNCGYTELRVYAPPQVAIVATGDELVEVGSSLEPWQIRNSNTYSLASLVQAEAAVADRLPIARDNVTDLRDRLKQAHASDLLLLSGGVSMGKYDLVEQVLQAAGAEFFFTGARIQPGKPVVFGRLPRPGGGYLPFFGLPGNPISTEVCFRLFVTPLLRALCGRSDLQVRFAAAQLATELRGGANVTRFLPAVLQGDWQGVTVQPVPWQGSGDLAANARANCFVVLPLGGRNFTAGETVQVLLR